MKPSAPNTLAAKFYDGQTPVPMPATLIWTGQNVKVIGSALAQDFPTNRVRVSPRIAKADRFISLPGGAQLQCPDSPLLDRLPQEGKSEGVVAWLENRWQIALACLAITLSGLAAGYFYGLPAAAAHIAANVPIEYEQQLGQQSIEWLDSNEWFQPSELDPEDIDALKAGFAKLTQGLPLEQHYRLEFRDAPDIGPNAFALPGGTIVLTDQMVELSESPEEIYAVLAHEIGHVERRHALRHVLQDSIVAAGVATLTGDAATLTLAVSGLPVILAQARYSREFESEADEFGFALLKQHGLSPEHFANLMERLSHKRDSRDERRLAFLSSHPVTADRIARARQAAQ